MWEDSSLVSRVVLRDFPESFIPPFAVSTNKLTQKKMWRRYSIKLFSPTRSMVGGGYNARLWEMGMAAKQP